MMKKKQSDGLTEANIVPDRWAGIREDLSPNDFVLTRGMMQVRVRCRT